MHRTAPTVTKSLLHNLSFRSLIGLSCMLLMSTIPLSACDTAAKQYSYSIFTFGTLVDITLYDVDRQLADAAFEQLQQDFDRFHENWSPWTNGDLAKINRQIAAGKAGSKTAIDVPSHLLPIIRTSITLSEKSSNNFNPAIGQLINLWQFHKYQEKDIKPPDNALIQDLLDKKPRMSDLSFDQQGQLISTNPAVVLNFGAFAKGYAIALEIEQLKSLGIQNAVINAGGDLSVIGRHGDRAWNIGIRAPRSDRILASIEVKDRESVFTSGDYERVYHYQGQRYHHILDPKTGYPTKDAQSVTVLHKDAGLADAAATAIFVAGSNHWQKIADDMGVEHVMLIDASGDIHLTEAMQGRIKFLNKSPASRIIVSEKL